MVEVYPNGMGLVEGAAAGHSALDFLAAVDLAALRVPRSRAAHAGWLAHARHAQPGPR